MLHFGSSLRCRDPRETLEIGRLLMRGLGISRVTDVTRMDRLGLPVCVSVRPRGLALCVHAGKGLSLDDARVGALMEAVEYAAAEPQASVWRRRVLRLDALERDWGGELRLIDLAPRMGPPAESGSRFEVVRCEDMAGGRPMWIPAELVFVPFEPPASESLFGWSTNGLASGNSLDEASLHALLEVLERDAAAMNAPRDRSCWLDVEELPEPFCSFAAVWRDLGVSMSVRYVPNEFGLPCFSAVLHEDHGASVDLAGGAGLHLDASIALARAVCEAAQSRLSHIHGGRDDITRFYARHDRSGSPLRDARASLAYREAFDRTRRIAWSEVPNVPTAGLTTGQALAGLMRRLKALGFAKVLRHHFDLELGGLHVVKVVVPRCQEIDAGSQRMGLRLYERVMADA